MAELKFKTNMMCDACVARVGKGLDQTEGIEEWSVDLNTPDKVLTVKTITAGADEIMRTVVKSGYQIEE